MSKGERSKALTKGKPALQAAGLPHVALFGSYALGDAGAAGDLDVLIDIDQRYQSSRFVDLEGVVNLLTDITG